MNAAEGARDAAALHLWDEGIVRPESAAFAVVDFLVREGHMTLSSPPADDAERRAILDAVDEVKNPFGRATASQEKLILDAAEKWASRGEDTNDAALTVNEADDDARHRLWMSASSRAEYTTVSTADLRAILRAAVRPYGTVTDTAEVGSRLRELLANYLDLRTVARVMADLEAAREARS